MMDISRTLKLIDVEARELRLQVRPELGVDVSRGLASLVHTTSVTVTTVRAWLVMLPNKPVKAMLPYVAEALGHIRDANWATIDDATVSALASSASDAPWKKGTRAEWVGWAAKRGILDILSVNSSVFLSGYYYMNAWPISVCHLLSLGELGIKLDREPKSVRYQLEQVLEQKASRDEAWRIAERGLLRPEHPGLAVLWQGLRDQHQAASKWVHDNSTRIEKIEADTSWTVLRCRGQFDHCRARPGFNHLTIGLGEPFPVRCGCAGMESKPCQAKIALLRDLLNKISARPSSEWVNQLAANLGTPLELRWFNALERALAPRRQLPTELSGMPAWLGWAVNLHPPRVDPVNVRDYKRRRGDAVVIQSVPNASYLDIEEEFEDERDKRLYKRWRQVRAQPNSYGRDDLDLILELADHPRVYLSQTGAVPVTVKVIQARLRVERTDEAPLDFAVLLGQRVLTLTQFQEQFVGLHSSVLPVYDEASREIRCFVASPALRRAVAVAAVAPKEELSELVVGRLRDSAAALTRTGALELAPALRGREVPAQIASVVVLELGDRLRLQLRAQPLTVGASVEPGEGDELVYGHEGAEPVYCTRDLAGERAAAHALIDRLGLDLEESEAHIWSLGMDDRTLDVIERLHVAEADGIDVRWTAARPRLGQAASGQLKVALKKKRDWFQLDGLLKTEDGAIPLHDLLNAAREGRRWVRIDAERWVRLEDRLKANIEALADAAEDGDIISPLASSVLTDALADGVSVEGPAAWMRLTDRLAEARNLDPKLPDTLTATLRPYQLDGFAWLARLAHWSPGACLADDMGLGKTIQALALLLRRGAEGPALVVAPTSLGFNWLREAERFAPSLVCLPVRSGSAMEPALERLGEAVVVITSYDLVARHIDRLSEVKWATVVFDEAQALKNPATQRARSAVKLDAGFRLALTGTPLENHTGELWSLCRVVVPGLLGSEATFRERFQNPIERSGDKRARRRLAAIVSPFILRRLKGQVARDLPERTDIRLDVTLSRAERQLYDELRRSVVAELEAIDPDANQRFQLLAAITRLRQLACHPRLYLPDSTVPSSKLALLREKVEELRGEGYRALIFSQFTQLLELVRIALVEDGVRCSWLDGSLSATARQRAVEGFQAGESDVFLLSIKAGGTGLNLTAASFVFLLDPWWNPAVETQATDRAHRIGQTEPVTVYRLVAGGTIEEAIYSLHEEKRALMDAVLAGTGSSGSMSPDELRALITTASLEDDEDAEDAEDDAPVGRGSRLLAPPPDAIEVEPVVPTPAAIEVRPVSPPLAAIEVESVGATPDAIALEAPVPPPAPPVKASATPAPARPRAQQPAAPSDTLALARGYLDQAVKSNALTRGSATVYRGKLGRMIAWLEQEGVSMNVEAIQAAIPDYKEAITRGIWEAPPSDASVASTVALWLGRALTAAAEAQNPSEGSDGA